MRYVMSTDPLCQPTLDFSLHPLTMKGYTTYTGTLRSILMISRLVKWWISSPARLNKTQRLLDCYKYENNENVNENINHLKCDYCLRYIKTSYCPFLMWLKFVNPFCDVLMCVCMVWLPDIYGNELNYYNTNHRNKHPGLDIGACPIAPGK